MVAHPQRADLAADEAAFKTKLAAAASGAPTVSTNFEGGAISFHDRERGRHPRQGGGRRGRRHARPEELFRGACLVRGHRPLRGARAGHLQAAVPTAVDIGVRLSGFDLNAAAQEAIVDIKLAGDGPWLGKEENDKVVAKLVSAGPLIIEIPLSHVRRRAWTSPSKPAPNTASAASRPARRRSGCVISTAAVAALKASAPMRNRSSCRCSRWPRALARSMAIDGLGVRDRRGPDHQGQRPATGQSADLISPTGRACAPRRSVRASRNFLARARDPRRAARLLRHSAGRARPWR